MKQIENKKKHFVLGLSGTSVICNLLDEKEQIKAANESLTDQEVDTVYSLLQAELAEMNEEQQEEQPY